MRYNCLKCALLVPMLLALSACDWSGGLVPVTTPTVTAQEQISQEAVFAEIGRLSLAVKFLTERVQQLEKEKQELERRLEKYEPKKPEVKD